LKSHTFDIQPTLVAVRECVALTVGWHPQLLIFCPCQGNKKWFYQIWLNVYPYKTL